MTREEALNILHNASVYQPGYLDALNMAIEVLEQEPCEDCISRQAVIDALCDVCELFHRNGEQTCLSKCESYHFLATLPSVNPKKIGHWMPRNSFLLRYKCSECNRESEKYNYCPNCGCRMVGDVE